MKKIAIMMQYAHNDVGVEVMEISEEMLPLDVAPGMVCHELKAIPEGPVYLGRGELSHHTGGDVIVIPVTAEQAGQIKKVYSAPVEELIPGRDEAYYAEWELDIRACAALDLAHKWLADMEKEEVYYVGVVSDQISQNRAAWAKGIASFTELDEALASANDEWEKLQASADEVGSSYIGKIVIVYDDKGNLY